MAQKTTSQIVIGSTLKKRFIVEAILGEGTFSVVAKCHDTKLDQNVAIKINQKNAGTAQQKELAILRQLRRLDVNKCSIVKCMGFLSHNVNICIIFELLDQNLSAYMSDREHKPLTIIEVSPIVHQLATALHHLKYLGIVHADLKPENAMIVNRYEQPLRVKLIDFGLSFESAAEHGFHVGTNRYTAPEVMLGVPYNEPIDMWSLGVTVAELVIGFPLYPGKDNYEVLSFIQETQGPLPEHMLECGTLTGKYFHHLPGGFQQWSLKTPEEYERDTGISIQDLRCLCFVHINEMEDYMELQNGVQDGQGLFMVLLTSMLQLDPNDRIEPLEVLQHPFFNQPEEPQTNPGHHLEEEKEVGEASSTDDDDTFDQGKVSVGSTLDERYAVEAVLGEGSFGIVTRCNDTKLNQAVAVKIHKNIADAALRAQQEIAILLRLRTLEVNTRNIVECMGFFTHMGRACIIFELLDQSLYTYMNDRKYHPLPIIEVSPIVHQLATALHHLKSQGIVHADLKPENIMVENRHELPLRVKLIDFGLSFESAAGPGDYSLTICYSAPEVMLCVPYNESTDMWSLGVTVAELVIGFPLYPGKDNYEVLSFIQETQGPLPEYMLECGTLTGKYFHHQPGGLQQWCLKSKEEYEHETGIRFQDTRYMDFESIYEIEDYMESKHGIQDGQGLFMVLLTSMLQLDPNDRIEPLEVLQHPFFQLHYKNTENMKMCS